MNALAAVGLTPFRNSQLSRQQCCDLLVIGGGIHGAGIARDAAGRRLDVILVEQGDLAQCASSASTKLIHGGLRYLEHFEFRLVREALHERERLLELAPHLVTPLEFVLPHRRALARPAWLIRLGLFLYDHIAGRRRLQGSRTVRLQQSPLGNGLQTALRRAFVYSDCQVDDARLVVLNAVDAAARGATIRTRTRLVEAHRLGEYWYATVEDLPSGVRQLVRARALVNAAGPWVSEVLGNCLGIDTARAVRLVKGSHILVPSLYRGDHAFLLQNSDRRVIFAIPYGALHTLVGTTEIAVQRQDPGVAVRTSEEEIEYLCDSVNRYFSRHTTPREVVWSFAGVRPLYDDCASDVSAISRDYVIDVDAPSNAAPVVSVYGGKITTYRRVAEQVLRKLSPYLQTADTPWTHLVPLPGGTLPTGNLEAYITQLHTARPGLPVSLLRRWVRAYGTRTEQILSSTERLAELGEHFGADLYQSEVDYLIDHEWARTVEDILWRRSKLGLSMSQESTARLADYAATRCGKGSFSGINVEKSKSM